MAIRLVSLNIEQDKHLEMVAALLARERADVVCLMEVVERDVPRLLAEYPYRVFGPNFVSVEGIKCGVVIGAKQMIKEQALVYTDGKDEIALPKSGEEVHRPIVVSGRVGEYLINAAHLTWTPDGGITRQQELDIARLVSWWGKREGVVCGDFNLPRNLPGGNPLYKQLAAIWKDNIPSDVVTSIDPILHRANKDEVGRLAWMVDYIWSSREYKVGEASLTSGVSDHMAVVATVEKIEIMV